MASLVAGGSKRSAISGVSSFGGASRLASIPQSSRSVKNRSLGPVPQADRKAESHAQKLGYQVGTPASLRGCRHERRHASVHLHTLTDIKANSRIKILEGGEFSSWIAHVKGTRPNSLAYASS
jgi:hypothetical protein